MGNDGGSIPDRRDLVRSKPKAEQADKNNQMLAAWFFCALSKRPLQEPIVSCALGKLYNKDAIIEYLLDKSAYGDGEEICGHVKSLKDLKQLKLTPNSAAPASQASDKPRSAFICPLTLKEMTGLIPFVYLAPCGCVFSSAGLKAVSTPPEDKDKAKSAANGTPEKEPCPQCAKKFVNKSAAVGGDVRTINPDPEETQLMRSAAPVKSGKKRKADAAVEGGADTEETKEKPKKARSEAASINASMGITRAVANELAAAEKARKAAMSTAVQSLYQSKNGTDGKGSKETFLTRGTFTRYA